MGSINPVILLPQAAQQQAAEWAYTYASSITTGAGQFCTNPGLLLGIKSDALTQFIQLLSEEIIKIEPTCMLHPNIIGNYERHKNTMQQQKGVQTVARISTEVPANYGRQTITTVEGATFLENTTLHQEVFGPYSMVVQCESSEQLATIIQQLEGQLTGTILAEEAALQTYSNVVTALQNRVGRIIFNGVPTGVEVCPAMVHGGPYPASTDSRFTAVGVNSIKRWVRPVSFQNWPNALLPQELQNANPLGILRLVNGAYTREEV